jgi:hypothetical protein
MNDRQVSGDRLPTSPIRGRPSHLIATWSRSVAVVMIAILMGLTMIQPGSALADDQTNGTNSSEGTGIQVESWLLTVPYCIGKSAFAISGAVVGGLSYLFSGGNVKTAQSVWTTSINGTYILRPAHLRGEEPIHFLGKADGDGSEPLRHASK